MGACRNGTARVAAALLDAGADIDYAVPPGHDDAGVTPLILAVMGGHFGVVKLLLKRGADGTKTFNFYG
jgi:ankyrin repeat protein